MDITVAYFHSWLHAENVKRDFEQIRATGASNIVIAIHEQEEQRLARDFTRVLQQAHDVGLKVHLSMGRYGNLFAGPSLMPSWYTFQHPESRVKDRHGRYHDISCYNHEPFRAWLSREIEYYLATYPINGIVIDEPRGPDITCFCAVCRALCPDVADLPRFRRRSMIDFLGEVYAGAKRVNPHVKTSVVLLPNELGQVDELATIPALDTLGCHLFWQLLQEDMESVTHWGRIIVEAARLHNKRSQLWLQNFNLDAADEEMLDPSFTRLLSTEPDEVACYYYWRNNVDPVSVWQRTRQLLRRIPRRQLYWKSTSPRLPAVGAS